jgi:SPP1 family predicted phage head-tail adaptor
MAPAGAGRLRKRATFQSEVQTPDGGGGYALTWSDGPTVWCELVLERGRERVAAGRLDAAIGGVLSVRASSETRAINEGHRVLVDDIAYQIRSITDPDQRGAWLEMVVEKGVAT